MVGLLGWAAGGGQLGVVVHGVTGPLCFLSTTMYSYYKQYHKNANISRITGTLFSQMSHPGSAFGRIAGQLPRSSA